MPERIVITGAGTVNPLGHSVADSWRNATEGVAGVGPITLFDPQDQLVKIACEVKNYRPEDSMSPKEARRRDRFEQLAATAGQEALAQSGLEITDANASRVGVLVSAAIGGITSLEEAVVTTVTEGARRISPFAIPMLMPNGAAGLLAIDHGARGPSFAVASACATGADSIGIAALLLKAGVIDAAIAGASEAPITNVGVGAFDRIGATSRQEPGDGLATPRPFDRNRDGLVIGEGAGVLILETESLARARGAEILGELAGYAATADAYHVTAPAEDGAGGAAAMAEALRSASLNPDDVDYINAHGTATQLNDASETRAIKAAFGDLAYNIPVSSTKSMTGHMMGAAGAVEAIFALQAVREGVIPPTVHYQTPDPECDLDYVPNAARSQSLEVAMSNAFGFGGHNAVLVIRKYR